MNDAQLEYILNFFKSSLYGGREIARQLVLCGSCTIASLSYRDKLYDDDIMKFIKTTPAANAVGCSLLEFNLEQFLTSEKFLDKVANDITIVTADIEGYKRHIENLKSLETYFDVTTTELHI